MEDETTGEKIQFIKKKKQKTSNMKRILLNIALHQLYQDFLGCYFSVLKFKRKAS